MISQYITGVKPLIVTAVTINGFTPVNTCNIILCYLLVCIRVRKVNRRQRTSRPGLPGDDVGCEVADGVDVIGGDVADGVGDGRVVLVVDGMLVDVDPTVVGEVKGPQLRGLFGFRGSHSGRFPPPAAQLQR